MNPFDFIKVGLGALLFSIGLVITIGLVGITSDAHPRDNCECSELRAIRRILEQQTGVVCDEFRCLPAPEGTPNGGQQE